MGAQDQAWADALRLRYFPPERNHLPAHITLFHHLPPTCLAEVQDRLARLAQEPRPRARLEGFYSLGGGVAVRVESAELLALRDYLADHFALLLTPQDRASPRLHITIQNKVTAEVARATLAEVSAEFRPRPLVIAGLAAWHYRGGPWSLIRRYRFRG
ncbi:MAG TPA: 2'-5' RNA ligase family protein [Sphingobium sp.]